MKKLLLILLLSTCAHSGALLRWNAGSAEAIETPANWDEGGAPAASIDADDTLQFDSLSVFNATLGDTLTVALIKSLSQYTGTVDLASYPCSSTYGLDLQHAGTMNWQSAQVNVSGNITLANFTSNEGTALITIADRCTLTMNGLEVYDVTFSSADDTLIFADTTRLHDLTVTAGATIRSAGILIAGGDVTVDGVANHDLGSGVTLSSDAPTFHIGSGVGTITAGSCDFTMNATTSGIIDIDKALIAKSLSLSGTIAKNGTQTLTALSGDPLLALADGVALSINENSIIAINCVAQVTPITLGSGYTIDGNGILQIGIVNTAATYSPTLPAITLGGTATLRLQKTGSGAAATPTLGGAWDATTIVIQNAYGGTLLTVSTANYAITGALTIGSNTTSEGKGITLDCGSSIITVTSFSDAGGAYDKNTWLNMQTSQWTCTGNFTLWSYCDVDSGTSTVNFTGTGASVVTSAGKNLNAVVVNKTGGGSVATADSMYANILTITAGTIDISGDALRADSLLINSAATFTSDASSRIWMNANGTLRTGGKSLPLVYTLGKLNVYDGGTFADFRMKGSGGDSIKFEPAKRYTFTALDSDSIKGTNGTTGRNYWVSQTAEQRDTIDLPAKDTLENFFIRDQVFLDTVYCKRADSCFSGGGNY